MSPEELELERERLQLLLDPFNQGGALVVMAYPPPDDSPSRLGLGVEFTVVRVAEGANGVDYWIRWKDGSYTEGFGTHVIAMSRDPFWREGHLYLNDAVGRTFQLGPAPAERWAAWLEWKAAHAAHIEAADAYENPVCQQMVDRWELPVEE